MSGAAAAAPDTVKELPPDFEIQAQPLANALTRYGDLTGREVFYQARLVEGRISNPVAGRMAPLDALVRLLEGTGLRARFLDDGSFILSLPSQDVPSANSPSGHAVAQRYYAQIQVALRESFCRQGVLEPGTFRAVALIWIGPRGNVEHVQRLSSAGTPAIDRNIDAALLGVRLEQRPPAAFTQPALIMMVPQTVGATGCRQDSGSMRAGQP
ncbi:hypothetical protein E0H22_24315 [Rhodopseudomonas boonkerdii]|uniref:STN domain-containing protein n=1 Tax=Rhodopseudomonas boonkerdii TaxID=475937 RepID=UPI001E4572D8|nr:STN domain-containing protein [Rhodopseudomonas boonkerdii]UGV28507.1 hypothetical protein E0H22_24315 [Rhodopseudomonas boonkerdii]